MINVQAEVFIGIVGLAFTFMVWSFYAFYKWHQTIKENDKLNQTLFELDQVDRIYC